MLHNKNNVKYVICVITHINNVRFFWINHTKPSHHISTHLYYFKHSQPTQIFFITLLYYYHYYKLRK